MKNFEPETVVIDKEEVNTFVKRYKYLLTCFCHFRMLANKNDNMIYNKLKAEMLKLDHVKEEDLMLIEKEYERFKSSEEEKMKNKNEKPAKSCNMNALQTAVILAMKMRYEFEYNELLSSLEEFFQNCYTEETIENWHNMIGEESTLINAVQILNDKEEGIV
jgi:hypothetical protein